MRYLIATVIYMHHLHHCAIAISGEGYRIFWNDMISVFCTIIRYVFGRIETYELLALLRLHSETCKSKSCWLWTSRTTSTMCNFSLKWLIIKL